MAAPLGFQSGGKIPGYGGGDKIQALLEAGEYVINKQSAAVYNPILNAINNDKVQRFASGGMVRPQYAFSGQEVQDIVTTTRATGSNVNA